MPRLDRSGSSSAERLSLNTPPQNRGPLSDDVTSPDNPQDTKCHCFFEDSEAVAFRKTPRCPRKFPLDEWYRSQRGLALSKPGRILLSRDARRGWLNTDPPASLATGQTIIITTLHLRGGPPALTVGYGAHFFKKELDRIPNRSFPKRRNKNRLLALQRVPP